jgi:hypothetical protein
MIINMRPVLSNLGQVWLKMLIFSMVKPYFVFVLLILFFILFGLESIDKFRAMQAIVIESTKKYEETVCATINGDTGWRNDKIKQKVLQTICNESTSSEQVLKCINEGTFNFSEMVAKTVDSSNIVLNESQWHLDLYSHGGKCHTLNTSAANIGTNMKHALTISYPEIPLAQYTMVHDPQFFVVVPNPDTMPRIINIQNPI